jgi:hypothetical protein
MDGISRKLGVIMSCAGLGIILNQPVRSVSGGTGATLDQGGQVLGHFEKVQVHLTCVKAKLSLQDFLTMDIAIRNDGADDVYLFERMDWGEEGGVARYIQDEKGKLVVSERGVLDSPPPPDDPAMLVRLEQGSFYGIRSRMKAKDLIPQPGRYTMKVIYRCPFERAMLPATLRGLPVITRDAQGIESNTVAFEVIP